MADVCKPGGPLSAAQRNALPRSAFGLPSQRSYPIPNVSHARNAKARAAQQYKAGRLSASERDKIFRRADSVIDKCKKGDPPGNPGRGRLWAYAGIGAGFLVITGLGIWWWRSRSSAPETPGGEKPETPSAVPPPPPGWEYVGACELYKGRTVCIVRQTSGGGLLPSVHWRVNEGTPSVKGYVAPMFAFKAAREFIDGLDAAPLPQVEPPEPEAGAEPDQPGAGLATGTSVAGVTATTADGACTGVTLNDSASWLPYATELLEGLNLDAWSSQELMDRIWKETFPICGDHVSEVPGFTVNGEAYASVVAKGQDFLDEDPNLAWPATKASVFASIMVGESFVPVAEPPVLQVDLGPDNPLMLHEQKPGSADMYWVVTTEKNVLLPGGGGTPSVESTWRVWGPNTNIVGDPVADGQTGSRAASLNAARAWIAGAN